jgi:hypothetical protein
MGLQAEGASTPRPLPAPSASCAGCCPLHAHMFGLLLCLFPRLSQPSWLANFKEPRAMSCSWACCPHIHEGREEALPSPNAMAPSGCKSSAGAPEILRLGRRGLAKPALLARGREGSQRRKREGGEKKSKREQQEATRGRREGKAREKKRKREEGRDVKQEEGEGNGRGALSQTKLWWQAWERGEPEFSRMPTMAPKPNESFLRNPQSLGASQRSLHNAPIFRLLLKVAVNGTHQCDFLNFCGTFGPQQPSSIAEGERERETEGMGLRTMKGEVRRAELRRELTCSSIRRGEIALASRRARG